MHKMRLLQTAIGVVTSVSILAAISAASEPELPQLRSIQLAAACAEQPTPKCLLADAQVAAMLIRDHRLALPNLTFVGWLQSLTGDRDAALDTLRVGDLRLIGAGPELLGNYHAAVAGVWMVLKDEAKAKAAIDLALQHLEAAEEYSRAIALADVGYAQALLGDRAAASDSTRARSSWHRSPAAIPFSSSIPGGTKHSAAIRRRHRRRSAWRWMPWMRWRTPTNGWRRGPSGMPLSPRPWRRTARQLPRANDCSNYWLPLRLFPATSRPR